MSDVTLLRTLTRKSKLKYGQSFDRTVADMLIQDRMRLARDYFHLSAITFTDEVLDEIGIPLEMRISKPGKLPYREAQMAFWQVTKMKNADLKERVGERAYMNICNGRKRDAKIILSTSERAVRQIRSKLAWKNQGH